MIVETQNVSFPRSGHHLLVRCLKQIFPGEIGYCEYYNCCRSTPCVKPGNIFQKNHDFGLRLSRLDHGKYLVQYRHPVEAISSWFAAHIASNKFPRRIYLWDTAWHWKTFFRSKIGYWHRFIQKWVIPTIASSDAVSPEGEQQILPMAENVLLLGYHDFIAQPRRALRQVSAFLDPNQFPRRGKVNHAVQKQEVRQQREFREFRFYDHDWLVKVENRLDSVLSDARIPRLTTHD